MTILKIYGILLIALGIPFGLTVLDDLLPVSYWVATGLCVIFFSPERINDERVRQLKMKALFTAMSMGLGLTFLACILWSVVFPDSGAAPHRLHRSISAWDFLAGVLAVSLILFYFCRWLDARPERESSAAPGGAGAFGAPWSAGLKALSLMYVVVLLVVGSALGSRFGVFGWISIAATVLLLVLPLPFVVRGYAILGNTLVVRRLGWSTRLPLTDLLSATADPEAFRDSYRLFGNGGCFSYTGLFRSTQLGNFRAFVTDPARAVVLRWAGRTVVISPAAPREFIRELPVAKPPSQLLQS